MRTGKILNEVLNHLFKKPATVTTLIPTPPGFRGAPYLESTLLCASCGMCARDCPAQCIEMVTLENGKKYPAFELDRCAFCAQCAESCPRKCIKMAPGITEAALMRWELRKDPKYVPAPEKEPKKDATIA